MPLAGRSQLPNSTRSGKAQHMHGGYCPCHSWCCPREQKRATSHILATKTYKIPTGQCFASKTCTLQGSSMEWRGAAQHRAEHITTELTLASVSSAEVTWLATKLSQGLSRGWVVFYLSSYIRIHLHAEVWIFRPFKVNSLQYVNQLLSGGAASRG